MASSKYKEYLAAQIIAEGGIVSYRQLSRHLKVSSNTAKRLLYSFHTDQNSRRPSSVHATYLLSGILKAVQSASQVTTNGTSQPTTDGKASEDTIMAESAPSSSLPLPSSSLPHSSNPLDEQQELLEDIVKVTTIQLVQEQDLDAVKARFESIDCIHIYSLAPNALPSLQMLSECNRKVSREYKNEDLLETWKTYGTIYNPRAQRRTTKIQMNQPQTKEPTPMTAGMKPTNSKIVDANKAKAELNSKAKLSAATVAAPAMERKRSQGSNSNSRPSSREGTKPNNSTTTSKKNQPATLKREGSSSIFSAFAKTPAPKPKSESKLDVEMNGPSSEDDTNEAPELANKPLTAEAKAKAEAARKAKADREASLKAMMDVEEPDQPEHADSDNASEEEDREEDEDGDAPMQDAAPPEPAPAQEQEETTTTSNGRRRGRRRVMKKKTTKDADGYLVTREEPVWESFSEDETTAPIAKKSVGAKEKAGNGKIASGAASSGGAKGGQGNIKNFFKKG